MFCLLTIIIPKNSELSFYIYLHIMSTVFIQKYRSANKINQLGSSIDRTQLKIFDCGELIKDFMKVAHKSLHCRSKFCYSVSKFGSID